jgi:hypothetical protein
MKIWIKQLHRLVCFVISIREREAAQRKFMRGIYEGPARVPADYERPAYLRRSRLVAAH